MYIRRIISVLGAALAIGVCGYITYISSDVDNSTILFNLVFLAIMLLMVFAGYLAGVRRLISTCGGLKRGIAALKSNEFRADEFGTRTSDVFHNTFLDDCYQQYLQMNQANPEASCDIRGFINEETIETYAHRGILEMIPDVLTSLGILGTFVGLVIGLRSFDPSGYEQMASSITPLINGIKVAFITSIYGIALSLSFSFNIRSEFSNLSDLVEDFLELHYQKVKPPYEVDSLSRLLEGQKSREDMTKELTTIFVEQMGKSFESVITPAYERMTEGIHHIVESFTESQTQVMANVCESVIRQMRTELDSDFNQLTTTIAQLQQAQASYTEFMDRSMLRMQQTFVTLQDNMAQIGQYNKESIDNLSAAQHEAQRINQEQKEAYQTYIRFMYQTLEKFSDVWERNSDQLAAYTEAIEKSEPLNVSRNINETLADISLRMKDVQRRQVTTDFSDDFASFSEDQNERMTRALRKLDDLEELLETPRLFRSNKRKKQ